MGKPFIASTATAAAMGLTLVSTANAEITITSWGGAYTASQQKAYGATWDKGGNDNINWQNYNGGLDEVRTQVASGTVTWDILDVLPNDARTGCDEGLFEPLDRSIFEAAPDGTPMDEDIMVDVPNDCVVPQIFWSYIVFYQKGTFEGEQPSTIDDFFDVGTFPGKRGVHTWPNALIEMALVADGVSPDEVYDIMSTDEGIDRAFAKLDAIKKHAVFWSAGSKPLEFVISGETSMALAFNGRVGAAILDDGTEFVPIWDGQVLEEEWLVLLNGAPHEEEAIDFLIHASAPEQLAGQAKYVNYGPLRASSLEIIQANEPWYYSGVDIMPYMPNRKEVMDRSVIANPDWWADNGDAVSERYNAWMGQEG